MKKSKTLLTACFIFVLLLNSCKDEELIQINSNNDFFITEELASQICTNLSFTTGEISLKSANEYSKKIKSIVPAPGKDNKTVFYIINYENGGFVILTADKRVKPIAAFSETGEFSTDAESYNGGLVSWLFLLKENVEKVREKNQLSINQPLQEWDNLISPMVIQPPTECEEYSTTVGPLLSTSWNQGCGYNKFLPYSPCIQCFHVVSGCVTVAMAQVMRYHQYPNTFAWSSMSNTYGNDYVAHLYEDLYDNLDPISDCTGTSIDGEIVDDVLKNVYGYSSANIADYNYNTVKSNLSLNRPVILAGGEDVGWWIFHNFENGHMWVCDGYMEWAYCLYDEFGNNTGRIEYLYYHMNWGYSGSGDGWYGFDGWQPTLNGETVDLSYHKKMIYNIVP